ncbi:hypothetical protein L226DRAFT_165791 [Lentinus tigrinus ALCF2SS1-7]|uniref:Uncharacterized protein n=1 Tax=Lentinus tigrinus ALCF2SS1-6 TaxID=1328759 RepID=A0A5C2S461_9APHY|nr:hypothetical protein L227DRAFT_220867 [Lentinus tigrinus ALCF2SS1-6]RPD71946.1 hypothetical protein L226DRAFT_165791 [Lentinus tigrinus ALCF2SS1-7]
MKTREPSGVEKQKRLGGCTIVSRVVDMPIPRRWNVPRDELAWRHLVVSNHPARHGSSCSMEELGHNAALFPVLICVPCCVASCLVLQCKREVGSES